MSIDPITAYVGDTDTHRDADVRGLLNPIKDLLERSQVAMLGVAHLNKNQQQAVMHRTSGAVAFDAAARLGWVVAKDPNDPDRRRMLAMFKHNLCARARSLAYTLDSGTVHWNIKAPDVDAETLLQASDPEARNEHRDAVDFLEQILGDGPMKQNETHDREPLRRVGSAWRPRRAGKVKLTGVVTANGYQQRFAVFENTRKTSDRSPDFVLLTSDDPEVDSYAKQRGAANDSGDAVAPF